MTAFDSVPGSVKWIVYCRTSQVSDRIQCGLRPTDKLIAAVLHLRISGHIRLTGEGIFDGAPRQPGGDDHVIGCGGMVSFGMPDDMDNVRLERHLQVDAGSQVRRAPHSGSSG